ENWFTTHIERPISWFNIRYIGLDAAHPDSNHMVSKVFFNAPNDFAAEARNISWGSHGILIGAELSTKRNVIDDHAGGFPVRGRHVTLNGYYKFFPLPGDTLQINVDMKKNGIPIAGGNVLF